MPGRLKTKVCFFKNWTKKKKNSQNYLSLLFPCPLHLDINFYLISTSPSLGQVFIIFHQVISTTSYPVSLISHCPFWISVGGGGLL